MRFDAAFWSMLDALAQNSAIVVDRPRGSAHPRFPDFIYPLDYGYLADTASMDGGGIDVWRGTDPAGRLDALLVTVDAHKRDSEIKLLLGCTEAEKQIIYQVQNEEGMHALLIRRDEDGDQTTKEERPCP